MAVQSSDLESFTILFIAVGTALGALVTTCCWNIRRSRCVQFDLCCLHCTRELMSQAETEADVRHTMNMLHEPMSKQDPPHNKPTTNRPDDGDTLAI